MLSISPRDTIAGTLHVPGDKSISHRALLFGAIAKGVTKVEGLSNGADVATTRRVLTQLGMRIENHDDEVHVHGSGNSGFKQPTEALDCGNSGTTARLLAGLLASQDGQEFTLTGDASLSLRPMGRVIEPLEQMNATLHASNLGDKKQTLPLTIQGTALKGIDYTPSVASAQVKSALLLAGLHANGKTRIIENIPTRDHSERMLLQMGADISQQETAVMITPGTLHGAEVDVPGDFSSAAFFLTLACIHPNARITLNNINTNPTRTGLLLTLQDMGAQITTEARHGSFEPSATIKAQSSNLKGIRLSVERIPAIIDELPVLAVAATQAKGETLIEGARELRTKESDRIRLIVDGLKAMGAEIEEREDGMLIRGQTRLSGTSIKTHGDHRIAMAFAIAACIAEGTTTIDDETCIDISYPEFFRDLDRLSTPVSSS